MDASQLSHVVTYVRLLYEQFLFEQDVSSTRGVFSVIFAFAIEADE